VVVDEAKVKAFSAKITVKMEEVNAFKPLLVLSFVYQGKVREVVKKKLFMKSLFYFSFPGTGGFVRFISSAFFSFLNSNLPNL